MMINERLQKFLKEAKIKLMIGGVLGAVTLSGGAATISHAQDNNVATEVEYNDDVTINPTLSNNTVEYDYEYSEQLKDYFDGKLTLCDAVHTGGATRFLYDGIARGISLETWLEFDEVKDAIINLNLDLIAGTDSEQLDIIYSEDVNYTRLEENTDIVLFSLVHREDFGLNKLAGDYLDHDVLLNLDNIYNLISNNNESYIASDYVELKNTLDFFLLNGEINGHKFEELTNGGKRLALVSYERIKIMIGLKYNSYNDVNEIPSELSELYQITKSMDVLSVATILNATNLLTYEFTREAIAPIGVELFDINDMNYVETQIKKFDESVPSFAGKKDKVKSLLFVNNFNRLTTDEIAIIFGRNIDINTEFGNMEEYLNAVLKHNSTHNVKEHMSLVDSLTEHNNDKLYVAYLESFYKVIKYELETNQLDERHVSAILKYVLDYYNGYYLDNPGTQVRYIEHLSNGGMLAVNNILNQYKVLLKDIKVDNKEVNTMIEQVNNINLTKEVSNAETKIFTDFEKMQESINYYTVQKGDALWKIARKYGMTAQQLYDLNRDVIGDNPNLIYPGQKFKTNLSYDYEEQFKK